jgi:putative adenylate-forming enzyme
MSRARIASAWAEAKLRTFSTRAALERHQRQRIAKLLPYVRARSPFYRARISAPTLDALRAMEPIDKNAMMAAFDTLNTLGIRREDALRTALAAEDARDFRPTLKGVTVGMSSGTSGNRGLFLVSDAERYAWAGTMLARLLPGSLLSPRRDRVAFFLRANSNLYEALGSRRLHFAYFDLLEPLAQQLPCLRALDPSLLVGPPSLLCMLAAAQLRGELSLQPARVISVAEVLEPLDEARIRRAFGTTVHQVYQATEGMLGTTCAYGTVHLCEDLLLFERDYVDADKRRFMPIVSDLYRRTQPILRYRLNDVLMERETPCLCGSVLTGLEQIEGRADDVFLVAIGRGCSVPLYPDFVRRAVLSAGDCVRAYHVRQHAFAELEVWLDVQGERKRVEEQVRRSLGQLFVAMGGKPPNVHFSDTMRVAPAVKLRRVERCFSVRGDAMPDGLTR